MTYVNRLGSVLLVFAQENAIFSEAELAVEVHRTLIGRGDHCIVVARVVSIHQ